MKSKKPKVKVGQVWYDVFKDDLCEVTYAHKDSNTLILTYNEDYFMNKFKYKFVLIEFFIIGFCYIGEL